MRHGHSLFLGFTENEEQTHLVGDVIHHDDTVGTTVVAGGDGSKPLLACCVPLSKAPLKQHMSVTASTQIQRSKSLTMNLIDVQQQHKGWLKHQSAFLLVGGL